MRRLQHFIVIQWLFIRFTVAPSITVRPTNQTVEEGGVATFNCSAIGNPVPNITWINNGKTVTQGNTLSIDANRNHSGRYWCLADNGLNPTVNASANLDVQCKFVIDIGLMEQ